MIQICWPFDELGDLNRFETSPASAWRWPTHRQTSTFEAVGWARDTGESDCLGECSSGPFLQSFGGKKQESYAGNLALSIFVQKWGIGPQFMAILLRKMMIDIEGTVPVPYLSLNVVNLCKIADTCEVSRFCACMLIISGGFLELLFSDRDDTVRWQAKSYFHPLLVLSSDCIFRCEENARSFARWVLPAGTRTCWSSSLKLGMPVSAWIS